MKIIESELVMMCDVDDTLVMWGPQYSTSAKCVFVSNPHDGERSRLVPNKGNIKILKDRKARGSFIVVWSAGGYAWAQAVVEALDLEKYVDLIMTKPHAYIDDKQAEDIMGERIYIPYGSGYGE